MQPVKKQLKQFVLACQTEEEYQRMLRDLVLVSKSKEWKTAIAVLWEIKNQMAIELLESPKFTKQSETDKDITQRVYHNISEWIDFLTRPAQWVQKKSLIQKFKPASIPKGRDVGKEQ